MEQRLSLESSNSENGLKTAAGRSKRPLAIVGIAIESDRGERVATKLPPATQSEPGLFGSGDHTLFLFVEAFAGSYLLNLSGSAP